MQTIPVLVLTSALVVLLLHLVPGDLATIMAGSDAEPEVLDALRTVAPANGFAFGAPRTLAPRLSVASPFPLASWR